MKIYNKLIKTYLSFVLISLIFVVINSNAQNISGGNYHSSVICSDSTVWITGSNTYFQKGSSSEISSNYFMQVTDQKAVAINSGGNSIQLIDETLNVWTWGYNKYGQAGNNTENNNSLPFEVQNLSNIIQLESGDNYTLALTNEGLLWAWGTNNSGQLGDGTTAQKLVPVLINIQGVKQVSASQSHTLALLHDGTVWSWGNNTYNQTGQISGTNTKTPLQVQGLSNITKVEAGDYFSLVLKEDGSVWSWGLNELGNLGIGSNNPKQTAVPVGGLSKVIDISTGQSHVLALTEEGKVYAWGLNLYGQLGIGTNNDKNSPQELVLTNITMIGTGIYHSMAVNADGEYFVWGLNNEGQLGDNTTSNRTSPMKIDLPCVVSQFQVPCPTKAIVNTSETTICQGENIHFSSLSLNTTNHKWLIQDQEYLDSSINHVFNNSGNFDVRLVANPFGCSDTSTITVTINEVPNAAISAPPTICENTDSVIISVIDSGGVWTGSVNESNIFNPIEVGIGLHEITYSVSNGFCSSSDTVNIEVVATPVADFAINQINDSTFQFINNSTQSTVTEWLFGDGTSSNDADVIHQYDSSGVFNIVQIVEGECGTDVLQKQIVVKGSGTGIGYLQENVTFSVFPNPARDKVIISGVFENRTTIKIINALGQKMIEYEYSNSTQKKVKQIDVSHFDAGIYYILLNASEHQNSTKLIINK